MRCQQMGATCVKLEPPAHPSAPKGTSGDPDKFVQPQGVCHATPRHAHCPDRFENGKRPKALHREVAKADVLLTLVSPLRPAKTGFGVEDTAQALPHAVFGSHLRRAGAQAEEPGHDLTYLAENNLVNEARLTAYVVRRHGGLADGIRGRAQSPFAAGLQKAKGCGWTSPCLMPPPIWRCRGPGV